MPTGYFRLGDDVLLGVRNNTLKIKNIRYNPQVSLMIESGSTRQDIKGVMIQGNATVIDDPDEFLHYAREAARLRGVAEADLPAEPRPGAAYIKVTPHKNPFVGLLRRTSGNQRLTCHDYYCTATHEGSRPAGALFGPAQSPSPWPSSASLWMTLTLTSGLRLSRNGTPICMSTKFPARATC